MGGVSVVLPTFNEAGNIGRLIEELGRVLPPTAEIIVVDDDSPDRTWEVVEGLKERYPRLRLIRRLGRRGLTSAIREGIEAAQGPLVFWMDCDLSMPPALMPRLLEGLKDHDIVVASRYVPGGAEKGHSLLGSFLSRWICRLSSWFLDPSIKDYTSGYVGTRKEVLEAVPLEGDYGEYCIAFLYRALRKRYRILEIPYTCLPRHSGESKTATHLFGYLKRGRKYLTTLIRLRLQG
jgi:dolichol-phosphate mannosyltransferase